MKEFEIYFNRPKRPADISPIYQDVLEARHRLVIASAWFTDKHLAECFIQSPAKYKLLIVNQADKKRGSYAAFSIIANAFTDVAFDESLNIGVITELGSADWKEGVMHHKIVIADDVVWTGSYNHTFNAQNNYENLIRIASVEVANQFYDEMIAIAQEEPVWIYRSQFAYAEGIFRCGECEQLFDISEAGMDRCTWMQCKYCVEKWNKEREEREASEEWKKFKAEHAERVGEITRLVRELGGVLLPPPPPNFEDLSHG